MFRWYAEASKCYVYLEDVSSLKRSYTDTDHPREAALQTSIWFTRGWTLQELIAPRCVEFYARDGACVGDKHTLAYTIHKITNIPIDALHGTPLADFRVEDRWRWVSGRKTAREEDEAYCLIGIFGVSMAPRYGEGKDHAFQRLKTKIADTEHIRICNMEPPQVPSDSRKSEARSGDSVLDLTGTLAAQDRRAALLASLAFDQMEARQATIKAAYSTTCKWFLTHPDYLKWLDPDHLPENYGFLWIAGKPGAGKSTLMKFLHNHAEQERLEHEVIISFFFNARGTELEKSTLGMYRALLLQLLQQATDLHEILDNVLSTTWTIDILGKLLTVAASKLGQRHVKIFIDALDECDEEQVQEMVSFFEGLGLSAVQDGRRFQICFASRHYPTIHIQYGHQLTLETQQGHEEDIAEYVQRRLQLRKGKFAEDMKTQMLEKANGIFMWAVLVVPTLNKEIKDGRKLALKARLGEIPPELSDLFRDILQRDHLNQPEFLCCLQWILLAARPLTRDEFYFAMAANPDSQSGKITAWNSDMISTEDMARYVDASSKGLAELTKSKKPTVQFIHESVRDF